MIPERAYKKKSFTELLNRGQISEEVMGVQLLLVTSN